MKNSYDFMNNEASSKKDNVLLVITLQFNVMSLVLGKRYTALEKVPAVKFNDIKITDSLRTS